MPVRRFLRSRRAHMGMMTALLLPVMFGAVGLAIDVATMVRAQSKLQNSLDAALLASSRIRDQSSSRREVFDGFFEANMVNARELRNVALDFDVDEGLNYIGTTATAHADVDLNFAFLFGQSRSVSAKASAYESTSALEVVMVLDNTGSMGAARMQSLRDAATALVDILETAESQNRSVRGALVPFVTAVNVKGPGFKESWIDLDAENPHHGANFAPQAGRPVNHLDLFDALGVEWKGCVEARPAPYNLTDEPPDPSRPETLFVPYFAPDEPGNARRSNDSGAQHNNTYLDDMVEGGDLERQRSIVKYRDDTPRVISETGPLTTGPNYACPTPIMPLTGDFDTLRGEIARMIHWNGSGTNASEGLAWATRVLSPHEPYTEGAPFGHESTSKVVVVFTDGENNVFGASGAAINKSDYGSYGFVDQGRMGSTNRGQALTNVNTFTLNVCEDLKAKDVQIFTVLLGAGTAANRTLYERCATTPAHFYPTSDVSQLEGVFRRIGIAVAQLYVTN